MKTNHQVTMEVKIEDLKLGLVWSQGRLVKRREELAEAQKELDLEMQHCSAIESHIKTVEDLLDNYLAWESSGLRKENYNESESK